MKLIFALLIAIIFLSCGQEGAIDQTEILPDSTKTTDSIMSAGDSTKAPENSDSLLNGAYRGTFPCIDCKYIQQTIVFDADNLFYEERLEVGKNEMPQRTSGNWKNQHGEILLTENGEIDITLLKQNGTLYFTSMNGVHLGNSGKYILTKLPLADEEEIWDKKKKEGIEFVAMGNKPAWNLQIYNYQYISFKVSDWKKPLFLTGKEPIVNKDSSVYFLKKDTSKFIITVFPQTCIDSITNMLYQYKVSVYYKGFLYNGCGVKLSKKKLATKLSKLHMVHKNN